MTDCCPAPNLCPPIHCFDIQACTGLGSFTFGFDQFKFCGDGFGNALAGAMTALADLSKQQPGCGGGDVHTCTATGGGTGSGSGSGSGSGTGSSGGSGGTSTVDINSLISQMQTVANLAIAYTAIITEINTIDKTAMSAARISAT